MPLSIQPLALILNMNTRLFINALDGVTEEQAKERISDRNNPLTWLAAHTVWGRYTISMILGKPAPVNPYAGLFENFKPFDPTANYSSLAENKEEWKKASALLQEALASVTEEQLAAESPIKNPTGDFSNAGTIAFLAQHESYDIGQIGFLKKYHTNEGMKY
jgi:hypothetical protein